MSKISDMRENYQRGFLLEENVNKDPITQFQQWFEEARNAKVLEANAMILSTVNKDAFPSSRTVLLKEIENDGFIFYTNYESDKGKDLELNPNVSLLFLWKELERQVRISGTAHKISKEQSQNYFHIRPKGSQIGAWTSPQSKVISNREILEERKLEIEKKYSDVDKLPLPDFWGGYKVVPDKIEFWQGRPNRLHDRLRFKKEDTSWKIERLAP